MKEKFYTHGLTLIELLITVSVFVVVLTIAIPSFLAFIQNNRTISVTNQLVHALHLARSEAIKRGVSVSVCAASNQNFSACGNNWNQGWIIFVNPDENNVFANDANEPLITVHQALPNATQVTPAPGVFIATYTSSGFAHTNTANLNFSVNATGCTGNNARLIQISVTGRIQTIPQGCS